MAKRKRDSDIDKLLKNIRKRRSKISKKGQKKRVRKKTRPHKKSVSSKVKRRKTRKKPLKKARKTRESAVKKGRKTKSSKKTIRKKIKTKKSLTKKVKKPESVKKQAEKPFRKKRGEKKPSKKARVKRVLKKMIKRGESPSEAGIPSEYLLKTDIDKLYQSISEKGMIKVNDASRIYKVPKEKIEEWGRILEDHDLAILHYPPFGDPFLLLKKYKKSPKIKKERKGKKRPMIINLLILIAFVLIVLNYTGHLDLSPITDLLPPEVMSMTDMGNLQQLLNDYWIYLLGGIIIIIALAILIKIVKKKRKGRKK